MPDACSDKGAAIGPEEQPRRAASAWCMTAITPLVQNLVIAVKDSKSEVSQLWKRISEAQPDIGEFE